MKDKAGESRREFLKNCVAGAVVAGVSGLRPMAAVAGQSSGAKSKVVIASDAQLYGANSGTSSMPDSARVQKLLDRAMQSFYDVGDPVKPWKKIVRPGEVVGLKVNTIAGPGLSTHKALVDAICERLKQAGVKASDIVIWDRQNAELERVGFQLTNDGNRERIVGSDDKSAGYEEQDSVYGSVNTRFSKLLTRTCQCMINLPVLKDHGISGVTLAMKNMYGVINNPYKFHDNNCSPYIADLNMLPEIRKKFRLVICDAMTGCYEGGPSFHPQYTWQHNSLLVAADWVALDHTGWQIIARKRAEMKMKTLEEVGRPPKYIAVAADAQHGLGINDPARIALTEV
jgi:uncharacterized protein (DUF362 family)